MKRRRMSIVFLVFGLLFLLAGLDVWAQNGNSGIDQANNMVRSYFNEAIPLLYAVGGVVGLIGAVKVYRSMAEGEQHTNRLAASWFGACLFLIVVATVLRAFFAL